MVILIQNTENCLFLSLSFFWGMKTFRESAAAKTWYKDLLYDIPKPPRPVEQPYSPAGEGVSQSFPLPPPVTPSEVDPHQTSQEYSC